MIPVWTPAKVGCYWYSDRFSIHTRMVWNSLEIRGARRVVDGYVLFQDREEVGTFNTLKGAQNAAEQLSMVNV